jgi:hypothetical protein
VAETTVANGAAVKTLLPKLGGTPELDPGGPLSKGPLKVVVYEGAFEGIPAFPPLVEGQIQETVFHNVVCIITPSGDPWYLSDVDLDGFVR